MRKHLVVLALAILAAKSVEAQQTGKTHFMMVSIHSGQQAYHPEMIIARDDTAQQVIRADKNSWMWTGQTFDTREGKLANNEDSLFLTLKPFFDKGWKLVTTNIIKNTSAGDDYIARYFFTKEDK